MALLKTLVGLSLIATTFAAQAAPSSILDGIVLNQTELKTYVDKKSEVCHFNYTAPNIAKMSGDCYGVPADRVTLIGDGDGKIVYADIEYPQDFGSQTFDRFNQSLRKKYGQPRHSQIPFVGNRYVRWQKPDIVVTLIEDHMSFKGNITYYTKALWNNIQREQQESKQKAAKQIDDML